MGSSTRLAAHYDMRAQHRESLAAARAVPLESLTDRELSLREQPVTIFAMRAEKSRLRYE
ncbi:hypothetical protein FIV50_08625 [Microbacterium foliorum]|uniref:Uncharacterized protein n=1 Tax=Microbacterium foliorum TaxID=104336 RepID=A0A4Y5YPU1_9MICO|nr:hypothetical protein [Microbacterium foliorum]QDE34852.1 hypothetical protein FIV50_08625 [Microbacterium foliorum]